MDRQSIIRGFLEVACETEAFSSEVAAAIRTAVAGPGAPEGAPYTWLVRWSSQRHHPTMPGRVVAQALVIADCFYVGGFLRVVPQSGSYQSYCSSQVTPLNGADLDDAIRARKIGIMASVSPKFPPPKEGTTTTDEEEFERTLRAARPIWVDDSPRGHVVVGEEPGYDQEGRATTFPIFGEDIEVGPGFRVEGVPQQWLGAYSSLTAYSRDGSKKFQAHFSNGGGGRVNLEDVPEYAEWRVPRRFVEKILQLTREADLLLEQEKVSRQEQANLAERRRLEEKFGVK